MGSKERRIREKEQRRRQIQDAAGYLFLNKGYNSTTVEEIAEMVELTPGAIYRHFKDKEELIVSLLMIPLEKLYKKTKEINNDSSLDVEYKVIRLKEDFYKIFVEDPLTIRTTFYIQIGDVLSAMKYNMFQEINDLTRKLLRLIAEIFEEGVSQGKFAPRKGIIYADMFWGMITGIFMLEEAKKKINPSKDFLKKTIDEAFDVFLCGVKLKA